MASTSTTCHTCYASANLNFGWWHPSNLKAMWALIFILKPSEIIHLGLHQEPAKSVTKELAVAQLLPKTWTLTQRVGNPPLMHTRDTDCPRDKEGAWQSRTWADENQYNKVTPNCKEKSLKAHSRREDSIHTWNILLWKVCLGLYCLNPQDWLSSCTCPFQAKNFVGIQWRCKYASFICLWGKNC